MQSVRIFSALCNDSVLYSAVCASPPDCPRAGCRCITAVGIAHEQGAFFAMLPCHLAQVTRSQTRSDMHSRDILNRD